MKHSPQAERFDELLHACCEATATAEEHTELLQLLAADASLRQRYIIAMHLQVAAETHPDFADLASPQPDSPASWISPRPWRATIRFFALPTPLSLSIAAIVVGLFVTAMALVAVPAYRHRFGQTPAAPPEFVADLRATSRAVWEEGQIGAQVGSHLVAGSRLRLVTGLADVHFRRGASVVIEGPCELAIDGSGQATLQRGKLTCIVSPTGRGFIVETPTARFVDVGTEFGVQVDPLHGSDLLVLRGEVLAASRMQDDGDPRRLVRAGESLRFDARGARTASTLTLDQFADRHVLPSDLQPDASILPVASYRYDWDFNRESVSWPDTQDDGRELTNRRLAGRDFSDPEWVGFADDVDDGLPQPRLIFDLGAPCKLAGITIVYLHSAGHPEMQAGGSITAPDEARLTFSVDGVEFSSPEKVFADFDESPGSGRRSAHIATPNVQARYVKIDLRQATQWLFLTEVLFHGQRVEP